MKTTYAEPTVLWRLRHPDGRTAHALVVPRWNDASAVWFINDVNQDGQDFDDWASAVKWAEEVRGELEAKGWGEEVSVPRGRATLARRA